MDVAFRIWRIRDALRLVKLYRNHPDWLQFACDAFDLEEDLLAFLAHPRLHQKDRLRAVWRYRAENDYPERLRP